MRISKIKFIIWCWVCVCACVCQCVVCFAICFGKKVSVCECLCLCMRVCVYVHGCECVPACVCVCVRVWVSHPYRGQTVVTVCWTWCFFSCCSQCIFYAARVKTFINQHIQHILQNLCEFTTYSELVYFNYYSSGSTDYIAYKTNYHFFAIMERLACGAGGLKKISGQTYC